MQSVAAYAQPTVEEKANAVVEGIRQALNQPPSTPSTQTPKSQNTAQPTQTQSHAVSKAEAKAQAEGFDFLQSDTAGKTVKGFSMGKRIVAFAAAGSIAAATTVTAITIMQPEPDEPPVDMRYLENIHSVDDLNIGDIVIMGNYEKKDMEWRVTDKQNDNVLLVLNEVLLQKPFDSNSGPNVINPESWEKMRQSHMWETLLNQNPYQFSVEYKYGINWESCSLREWLNVNFLTRNFTERERERINDTALTHREIEVKPLDDTVKPLSDYTVEGGGDTRDKIFLLSAEECQTYFPTEAARRANDRSGKSCGWWLRSSGYRYEHRNAENQVTRYRYQSSYSNAPRSGTAQNRVEINGVEYDYDTTSIGDDLYGYPAITFYKDGAVVQTVPYRYSNPSSKSNTALRTYITDYYSGDDIVVATTLQFTDEDDAIAANIAKNKSAQDAEASTPIGSPSTDGDESTEKKPNSVTGFPVNTTERAEYDVIDHEWIQAVDEGGQFTEAEDHGIDSNQEYSYISVYQYDKGVYCFDQYGVRPAMWVHIA